MSYIKYELEGNYRIASLLRDHPELKYLPTAARERGMYGAFICGQVGVYFVFGYDEELIMRGKFIALEFGLYSEDEYFSDYRINVHGSAIRRLRYNAVPISGGHMVNSSVGAVIEYMNDLERITAIAKRFHIQMTEYFFYSTSFDACSRRYFALLSSAGNEREIARLEKELLHLFSTSMMTTTNPCPEDNGLTLADYRNSAYCVDSDPRKVEKMFHHPEKWEEHLFSYTKDYADNPVLAYQFVNIGILEPLEYILKQHHIPYRIVNGESSGPHVRWFLGVSEAIRHGDSIVLAYPGIYGEALLCFERWAYINAWFSDQERAMANQLFRTGQFYGFTIPLYSPLICMLRDRGVKLGAHELLQFSGHLDSMDCYCIVPLSQKPLVEEILLEFAASDAYTHTQGTADFYAASEMRIPRWEGGHQVMICRQGRQAGTVSPDGSVIMKSYYDSKIDNVPDEDLKAGGHLTEEPYLAASSLNAFGTDNMPDEFLDKNRALTSQPGVGRRHYGSWGDV